MANYAFLSLWCRKFTTENMLELYERVLTLFPNSEEKPGFYSLTVRGVSLHEAALLEQDDRTPVAPAEALAAAREFLNDDCAYELTGYWDLWQFAVEGGKTLAREKASPVEFTCYGPQFEESIAEESGHLCLQLGFEHLYTGHAGLLFGDSVEIAASSAAIEQEFLRAMNESQMLDSYREKTRANMQKLLDYVQTLEEDLPLKRRRLWSEGESDFEAQLLRLRLGHFPS